MELKEFIYPYLPMIYKMFGMYGACFLSVILDLFSGIRKSRAMGVKKVHSHGLRKTIDKLARYLMLLLSVSMIDGIMVISGITEQHGLPLIPCVTTVIAMVLCGVEFYSIWEKDENKGKYVDAAKMVKEVVSATDFDELADKIAKKLDSRQNENKDNIDTSDTSNSVNNNNMVSEQTNK